MANTIEQTTIDAYLNRIQRFSENVTQLQNRLNEMLGKQEPEQAVSKAPIQATAPVQTTAPMEPATPKVVTANDVDIDAILKGIDFGQPSMAQ